MKLSELIIMARLVVPGMKSNRVDDPTLTLLLNEGAADIAMLTQCLQTNSKFNVVAEQQQYNLTSVLTRYIGVTESGLYWNQGTESTPNWRQLYPRTVKWLDENRANWRGESSSSPIYYAIEGDTLIISPKPATALTNGFWMHYAQKPVSMTSNDHYPFGNVTEISRLSTLSWSLMDFMSWRGNMIINEKDEDTKGYQQYMNNVSIRMATINKRLDVSSCRETKFAGVKVV